MIRAEIFNDALAAEITYPCAEIRCSLTSLRCPLSELG